VGIKITINGVLFSGPVSSIRLEVYQRRIIIASQLTP